METQTSEQLKELVKEKYSKIAEQSKDQNETSCCGATGCSTVDYSVMSDDYSNLKGYVADADLGLGCGLPTEFALIKEGDTVIDLGSGAGNDCFVFIGKNIQPVKIMSDGCHHRKIADGFFGIDICKAPWTQPQ